MSAGDRSRTHLDGEQSYNRALNDGRFQVVLRRPVRISFEYDIPLLAGSDKTGDVVFGDRSIPTTIEQGGISWRLKPAKVSTVAYPWRTWLEMLGGQGYLFAGILTHEVWEATAMLVWGWHYDQAHEFATYAEHHIACPLLHLTPPRYERIWHPVIQGCEKKLHMPGLMLPPNLNMEAYAHV